MLYVTTPWGTVLHTGDISVGDHRTIKGVDLQRLPPADLMICEGTYGNRTHGARKTQERGVVETVQAAINRGGHVLIPAFAVGRAQEVILILKAFRTSGLLSPIKIFVDGMCKAVCTAYEQQVHDLHPALQNYLRSNQRALFLDPTFGVHAVSAKMRASLIAHPEPFVVISTSGMLSGGPAPVYARAFAQSERNAIIFTGYQDEEAPGAALLRTKQGDSITLGGQSVQLQCQVDRYSLSGHADANQIEQVVKLVKPRTLILVHGDAQALGSLAQRFQKLDVQTPHNGDCIALQGRPGRPAREQPPIVIAPAPPAELHPPTVEALYEAVVARAVPARPWTAIELGQALYGPAYHPGLRSSLEAALQTPAPYFKPRRLGSQTVYVPHSAEAIAAAAEAIDAAAAPAPERAVVPRTPRPPRPAPAPRYALELGMLVLVQGAGTHHGAAGRLGYVLEAPADGYLALVAEGWKGQRHLVDVVRLVPDVPRPDWQTHEPDAIREALRVWRMQLNTMEVDLMAAWHAADGAGQTFAELTAPLTSDDERLAFGLDLLQRGLLLWRQEGETWVPKPLDALHHRESVVRHIGLLAQAGARMQHKNGEMGVLTGRSGWGKVEVIWEATQLRAYVKDKDVTVIAPPPLDTATEDIATTQDTM